MNKKSMALEKVEKILEKIKEEKVLLEELQNKYQKELEEIQNKYYPYIEESKAKIKQYELELEKTAKKHKYELFDGTDIVETKVGRIIHIVKIAVKRARGVLEKLEQLGWDSAIIIEKKVNWDELEKWPDEKLIACGTERIRKEKIEYELKI